MATYYCRPIGAHANSEDGLTYASAWLGLENVPWGTTFGSGDELYVCGTHAPVYTTGDLGNMYKLQVPSGINTTSRTVIRGDYAPDPGIVFGWWVDGRDAYTDETGGVWSMTINSGQYNDWWVRDIQTDGTFVLLTPVDTLAECESTVDTVYSATYGHGTTLYAHLNDGGDPDTRIAGPRYGYKFMDVGRQYVEYRDLTINGHYDYEKYIEYNDIRWTGCTLAYGEKYVKPVWEDSQRIEFIDCDISMAGNGLYFSADRAGTVEPGAPAPDDWVVRGCTIHDIGTRPAGAASGTDDQHCIGIQGGRRWLVEGCTMYNAGSGVTAYAFINQDMYENTIQDNTIYNMTTPRLGQVTPGRGIEWVGANDAAGDAHGNSTLRNTIYDCDIGIRPNLRHLQEIHYNEISSCRVGVNVYQSYNNKTANYDMKFNNFTDIAEYDIEIQGVGTDHYYGSDYNYFSEPTALYWPLAPEGPGSVTLAQWQGITTSTPTPMDASSISGDSPMADLSNLLTDSFNTLAAPTAPYQQFVYGKLTLFKDQYISIDLGDPYWESDAGAMTYVMDPAIAITGLSFSSAGILSGTPTDLGDHIRRIDATNSVGTTNGNLFDIEVIDKPEPPSGSEGSSLGPSLV